MIIARPENLRFVLDGDKHSVNYAKNAKLITEDSSGPSGILGFGNFETIIAKDLPEAAKILKKKVGELLAKRCIYSFNPSDFRFEIYYSPVKEGCFWHNMQIREVVEHTPEY